MRQICIKSVRFHNGVIVKRDSMDNKEKEDELFLKQLFETLFDLTAPGNKGYMLRLNPTGFMLIPTGTASHYPEYFFSTEKLQIRQYKSITVKPELLLEL